MCSTDLSAAICVPIAAKIPVPGNPVPGRSGHGFSIIRGGGLPGVGGVPDGGLFWGGGLKLVPHSDDVGKITPERSGASDETAARFFLTTFSPIFCLINEAVLKPRRATRTVTLYIIE